jgi:hypothetical protein
MSNEERNIGSFEQQWNDYFTKPLTRSDALLEIGKIAAYSTLTPTVVEVLLSSPQEVSSIIDAVGDIQQNVEGLASLYKITQTPEFYYDARQDRSIIDITEPRKMINLGNSFARGFIDFTQDDDPNKQAQQMNRQNNTKLFRDHMNPPGRELVVTINNYLDTKIWAHWVQEDEAINGGTLSDVKRQVSGLRTRKILETANPKTFIIGAADNDTFLTPDIQTHFASLEKNIYQEETLKVAHTLDLGIAASGNELLQYLYELDENNQREQWNLTDIFLLGSPYLTHAEGVVIKLGKNNYQVMNLAENGLARSLLDNVSDLINTTKGTVVQKYKEDNKDSSYRLHYLSARLSPEIIDGRIIPPQLYQHYTFRGYSRLTARMAYMTEDVCDGNLGSIFFPDYDLEKSLHAT